MKHIFPVVFLTITSYLGRADFYAIVEGNISMAYVKIFSDGKILGHGFGRL